MGLTGWGFMAVASLLLTLASHGLAQAQGNQLYNDASSLHGRYKQNQAQINALNQSIASHRTAIAAIRRDMRSVSYGFGSPIVTMEFGPQIAAHNEAIARDQQALDLLQRRQAIIERSWNNNHALRNYYGNLRETSGRTIYDPKTRQNVNLMDYRLNSFRNPGARQNPPAVRSTAPPVRTVHRPPVRTTQSSGRTKAPPSTSRSSGQSKTRSTGGGSHTMSLTPVK